MHLPAVKRQLVARCRHRRQLPFVIVELFGGVLLAVVGDGHDASRFEIGHSSYSLGGSSSVTSRSAQALNFSKLIRG